MGKRGFIAIAPDKFCKTGSNLSDKSDSLEATEEQSNVRRPLRGLVQGEDYYSVLKVVKSNGTPIPITNSSVAGNSAGYTSNYLIQAVEEQRAEKSQIVETFGENFVYFFGERPRVMSFSGCLLNSEDFNWKTEFWKNYEAYFRGTKLIELDARIYISFDDVLVEGYMLGANASMSSEDDHKIPFSFQMLLTNYHYLRAVTTKFPDAQLANVPVNDYDGLADYNKYAASESEPGTLSKIMGAISGAINTVTSGINGAISAFKQIAFGRQIRVPVGAGGSEAMTSDFQVAQRGGIGLQAGKVLRTNLLKGNRIGMKFVPGNATLMDNSSQIGKNTYDNYDEYPNGRANLSEEAKALAGLKYLIVTHTPDDKADKEVRKFMLESGMSSLEVDGLTDFQLVAGKVAFGIVNFATSFAFESGTGPDVIKHERYDNDGPVVSERFVRQDHSKERAIEPVIIPNPARN